MAQRHFVARPDPIRYIGPMQVYVPNRPRGAPRNADPRAQRRPFVEPRRERRPPAQHGPRVRPEGEPQQGPPPNLNARDEGQPPPGGDAPHELEVINQVPRERVSVHYALTDDDRRYFELTYPNLEIEERNLEMPHTHPRLAFDRKFSEREVVQRLIGRRALVVDIGGNPVRHAWNHRQNIHSCCPVLDPVDAIRHINYQNPPPDIPMPPRYCAHRVEDCNCVVPDCYLSVHSLYYLAPATILALLQRCNSHTLHAIVHCFDDIYGGFCSGEAQYHVDSKAIVRMFVRGNSQPYVHSVMPWLRAGYFSDGVNAMAWTAQRDFACSRYYLFALCPLGLRNPISDFRPMKNVIIDNSYYGKVSFGGAVFGPTPDAVQTRLIDLEIDVDSVYSWGLWVFATGASQRSFVVPKALVSELAGRVAGLNRNSVEFARLVGYCKTRIREYNIPADVMADSIVLSSCLAFTLNVEVEASLIRRMLQDVPDHSRDLHSDLLNFASPNVFNFVDVIKILHVCFAILIFFMFYVGIDQFYLFITILFYGPLVLYTLRFPVIRRNQYAGLGLSLIDELRFYFAHFYGYFMGYYRLVREGFAHYNNSFVSFDVPFHFALPLLSRPKLNSMIVDGKMKPISLSSRVTPGIEVDSQISNVQIEGIGLINPSALPVVHRRCPTNDLLAVNNRFAVRRVPPDSRVFYHFITFVSMYLPYILPDLSEYREYLEIETFSDEWFVAYKDWNQRFPGAIQRLHNLALHDHIRGLADSKVYMRLESFMKCEKLMHSSMFQVKNGDPRSIQARNQSLNVVTGPWTYRFSCVLRKIWNINHFICYASGLTQLQIGSWLPEHNPPGFSFFERDTERFDASIVVDDLDLGVTIYQYVYADRIYIEHRRRDFKKSGATKYGAHFSVEGRVGSGTDDTNLFDTIINALKDLYASFLTAQRIDRSILTLHQFLVKSGYKTLVCGDDGITRTRDIFPMIEPQIYLQLGFVVENMLVYDTRDMSFCSGRFWPTSRGMSFCVHLGRVFAKNAWYVDVPSRHLRATHRAVLIAITRDFSFIPPILVFANSQLRLLENVTGRALTTGQFRNTVGYFSRHNVETGPLPVANRETWDMLAHVYSWTQFDQKLLEEDCSTVLALPSIFQPRGAYKFLSRDDCTIDPRDYTMDISFEFYVLCVTFFNYFWFRVISSFPADYRPYVFRPIRYLLAFLISWFVSFPEFSLPDWLYSYTRLFFVVFGAVFYCQQLLLGFSEFIQSDSVPIRGMFVHSLVLYYTIEFLSVFMSAIVGFTFHLEHYPAEITLRNITIIRLPLWDYGNPVFLAIKEFYDALITLPFSGLWLQMNLLHEFWTTIFDGAFYIVILRIIILASLEEIFKNVFDWYGLFLFIVVEATMKFLNSRPLSTIALTSTLHFLLALMPLHWAIVFHSVWNVLFLFIAFM